MLAEICDHPRNNKRYESFALALRALVTNTSDEKLRRFAATQLGKPDAFEYLARLFPEATTAASGFVFLGTLCKDFGEIPCALHCFRIAVTKEVGAMHSLVVLLFPSPPLCPHCGCGSQAMLLLP